MDQKQRDKIAWVLAVVLGIVLIYLLTVNVFKIGKKSAPRSSAPAIALPAQPASFYVGEQVQSRASVSALDPKVLAEQQQIATRLPRRNPFSAVQAGAFSTVSQPDAAFVGNNEFNIKVTAIVSRPGSNKRIAMINGKMLEEGDRIGEWAILKVNAKNVVLGNGAQQMVVGVK